MDLKSKRVWLGIAAGLAINLITVWLELNCWSATLGVIVSLYVGKIYGPKQGAAVGAIVLIPVTALFLWQMQARGLYDFTRFTFSTAVGMLGGFLFLAAVGALAGAIIGQGLRVLKARQLIS